MSKSKNQGGQQHHSTTKATDATQQNLSEQQRTNDVELRDRDASAARQHQATSTHQGASGEPLDKARANNEELQQFVQTNESPEELEAQRQAIVGTDGEPLPVRTNDPSGLPSKAAAEGGPVVKESDRLTRELRRDDVPDRPMVEVPNVRANQRIDHLDPQQGEHGLYRDRPNLADNGGQYEPKGDRGIRDDGKTEAGRQSEAEADQNPDEAQRERQQRPAEPN